MFDFIAEDGVERFTVIDKPAYRASLSYNFGEFWMHLDVYDYNSDIYDEMVDDWFDIEAGLKKEGVTRIFAMPEKLGLVTKMGWEFAGDADTENGKRGVYVWEV